MFGKSKKEERIEKQIEKKIENIEKHEQKNTETQPIKKEPIQIPKPSPPINIPNPKKVFSLFPSAGW